MKHRKVLIGTVLLAATFFSVTYALVKPKYKITFNTKITAFTRDIANGEKVFHASGCESCHLDPDKSQSPLLLAGGLSLATNFGTFYSPNISPDKERGIGKWGINEFANAVRNGISPKGSHYFPSFPDNSYQGMTDQDLIDLYYFIMSLPPSEKVNKPHALNFPFSFRVSVGIWKHLYFYPQDSTATTQNRGEYLVKTLAHCAECHTPRTILGGLKKAKHLSGAKVLLNEGSAMNITPHETGIKSWTELDIVNYLETGFTPDFDSAGGQMVSVISNLAKLPKGDLEKIAQYLKSIKPIASN